MESPLQRGEVVCGPMRTAAFCVPHVCQGCNSPMDNVIRQKTDVRPGIVANALVHHGELNVHEQELVLERTHL